MSSEESNLNEEFKSSINKDPFRKQCMYGILCNNKMICPYFHPVSRRLKVFSKKIEKQCMYGLLCNRKNICVYQHPQKNSKNVNCRFFNTINGCNKGYTCLFKHSS
jgi:hypothetical protein